MKTAYNAINIFLINIMPHITVTKMMLSNHHRHVPQLWLSSFLFANFFHLLRLSVALQHITVINKHLKMIDSRQIKLIIIYYCISLRLLAFRYRV